MAAATKLVIVESPTKARTIRKFLGSEYRVEASMGHVRDLPASAREVPAEVKGKSWSRLGVDVDNGFEPVYVIPPGKKKGGGILSPRRFIRSRTGGTIPPVPNTDPARERRSPGRWPR